MNRQEAKATLIFSGVFMTRMLGLFMILPVFSLFAKTLDSYSPLKMGLALGAYGLTQALLQLPLGVWSDHIGRKKIVIGGLSVFAIGSLVAGFAASIASLGGIIVGRALQGSGAVGAVTMAWLTDLTREEVRSRVMAFVGISIGVSFSLAMVLGPWVYETLGMVGIFGCISILALLGIVLVLWGLPSQNEQVLTPKQHPWRTFTNALTTDGLGRWYVSIFLLHVLLTMGFMAFPLEIVHWFGAGAAAQTQVYLWVMVLSLLLVLPLLWWVEKRQLTTQSIPLVLVGFLVVAVCGGYGYTSAPVFVVCLWVFFTAFNWLEASLPALLSRAAPKDSRGAVMGVFSTAQFLGMFVGGTMGGLVLAGWGAKGIYAAMMLITAAWVIGFIYITKGVRTWLGVSTKSS